MTNLGVPIICLFSVRTSAVQVYCYVPYIQWCDTYWSRYRWNQLWYPTLFYRVHLIWLGFNVHCNTVQDVTGEKGGYRLTRVLYPIRFRNIVTQSSMKVLSEWSGLVMSPWCWATCNIVTPRDKLSILHTSSESSTDATIAMYLWLCSVPVPMMHRNEIQPLCFSKTTASKMNKTSYTRSIHWNETWVSFSFIYKHSFCYLI